VLTDVAKELRDNTALDEEEGFVDATFVMAKGGGAFAVRKKLRRAIENASRVVLGTACGLMFGHMALTAAEIQSTAI
jgi:hypothetical protein